MDEFLRDKGEKNKTFSEPVFLLEFLFQKVFFNSSALPKLSIFIYRHRGLGAFDSLPSLIEGYCNKIPLGIRILDSND